MNNNGKIRNKSLLSNQNQKNNILNRLTQSSITELLKTDIMFFDDSITPDLVKKLTKIRKNVKESINSRLQKYSNFDN